MKKIWVDADSCARLAREAIEHLSCLYSFPVVYVANRNINTISNTVPFLSSFKVTNADEYIIEEAQQGDICITRDIPLSLRLLDKSIFVLNDKGNYLDRVTLEKKNRIRSWNLALSGAGLKNNKDSNYSKTDRNKFYQSLEKWIVSNR